MTWLRIEGALQSQVYRDGRDIPHLSAHARHELLMQVGEVRAGIDGETPNVTVTIRNSAGQAARMWSLPPIGAQATLFDGTAELFSGTVQSVSLSGSQCTVGIEAPLAALLPLRQTTAWGGYREAAPIPHRYGQCSGLLLQYNDSRTEFAWADHPVQAIDGVLVNGQPAGEWEHRTVTDSTGRPITIVVFGQPQDEGVSIIARGRGKLHPSTGALMTNPADVVWDVLANIAGQDMPVHRFDEFRGECVRRGLEVGGSIERAEPIQDIVRAICGSVGAAFCASGRPLAWLWPGGEVRAPRAIVRTGEVGALADLGQLANDLTVQYAYEDGQPRGSIRLEAPDSITRHGRRELVLQAQWVTSARVAFDVGQRLLQQCARPQWRVTVPVDQQILVGDVVQLEHLGLPVTGRHPVVDVAYAPDTRRSTATAMVPVGDVPSVHLVSQSAAYDPLQYTGAGVATSGTDRVITLTNSDGTPVADARVSVRELGLVAQTDAAGRVVFPAAQMPAGAYTLDVTTLAGDVLEIPILIV